MIHPEFECQVPLMSLIKREPVGATPQVDWVWVTERSNFRCHKQIVERSHQVENVNFSPGWLYDPSQVPVPGTDRGFHY